MFTGIIEATGVVKSIKSIQGDIRLTISSQHLDFEDIKLGDSIACNGICLTVVSHGENWYEVDVSRETISKSTVQYWQVGDMLNLEKAMLPTTRFGGHIVSGHVDTIGQIVNMRSDSRSLHIKIQLPDEFSKYVATKGSVTVDGISLTTNLVVGNIISLNIIPHTAQVTNIERHWKMGSLVNVEVDILARYLEKLILADKQVHTSLPQGISAEFLASNGFN